MRFFVLIAVALVLFFVAALLHRKNIVVMAKPSPAGVIPPNSVFHRPVGADCPKGTTLLPKYFSEADGSTQDACHNPNGNGSIDYLNPGEGCSIGVQIEPLKESEKDTL